MSYTSKDASGIKSFIQQGKKWMSRYLGEQDVFEVHDKLIEEKQVTEYLLSNTTIKINLPISGNTMTKTMLLTQRHRSIARLFGENFWKDILGGALSKSVKTRFTTIFGESDS